MNDERQEDARLTRILRRPAHLEPPPFEELATRRPASPIARTLALTLATVIVAVAALFAGRELSAFRQQAAGPGATTSPTGANASASATPRASLPPPIPQPITRISPAAQIAWVSVIPPQGAPASFIGVDPKGKIVGRLDADLGHFWRSADGSELFVVGDQINAYSASDGTLVRSYGRTPGGSVLDSAVSSDGRWLALLGSLAYVQIIDLQSGLTQVTPLGHDPNASHPGLSQSGQATALTWSTLVFAPDSKRLYTIVDWGGPLRLTAFDVTANGLVQVAAAIDGQAGQKFPSCSGPAIAPKVVAGGRTLVVFCYFDGKIWFFNLATLTSTGTVQADMRNPFWLAPIFTPDGQLLYLHQYPAFGDVMQVVDLRTQALLGPVPTPQKIADPGPFAWLFPVAYAGGTPSTVPVSPDGLRLYAAVNDGITVLRIPDLKPLAKLASGAQINEVWISGDGRTVFATDQSRALLVIAADGSQTRVNQDNVGTFVASERG
jgi:hypothetical protein